MSNQFYKVLLTKSNQFKQLINLHNVISVEIRDSYMRDIDYTVDMRSLDEVSDRLQFGTLEKCQRFLDGFYQEMLEREQEYEGNMRNQFYKINSKCVLNLHNLHSIEVEESEQEGFECDVQAYCIGAEYPYLLKSGSLEECEKFVEKFYQEMLEREN